MKYLALWILLLPLFAQAFEPLDRRVAGPNVIFSWNVAKSTRYQLRYWDAGRPTSGVMYSYDSCEIGRHSFTVAASRTTNRVIQLIAVPNLRRCP